MVMGGGGWGGRGWKGQLSGTGGVEVGDVLTWEIQKEYNRLTSFSSIFFVL